MKNIHSARVAANDGATRARIRSVQRIDASRTFVLECGRRL
jgi:hypothetical protein